MLFSFWVQQRCFSVFGAVSDSLDHLDPLTPLPELISSFICSVSPSTAFSSLATVHSHVWGVVPRNLSRSPPQACVNQVWPHLWFCRTPGLSAIHHSLHRVTRCPQVSLTDMGFLSMQPLLPHPLCSGHLPTSVQAACLSGISCTLLQPSCQLESECLGATCAHAVRARWHTYRLHQFLSNH